MKRMAGWIQNQARRFSVKLFFFYTLGLVITVALILLFVTRQYHKAYMEMASQYSNSVLTRMNNELESYLQGFVNISNMPLYYPSLLSYVRTAFPNPFGGENILNMTNIPEMDGFVSHVNGASFGAAEIYIFCDDERLLYLANRIPGDAITALIPNAAYQDTAWYRTAAESDGRTVIIDEAQGFEKSENGFFIINVVRDNTSGRDIGAMVLVVGSDSFEDIFSSYLGEGTTEYYLVLDDKGKLRYSNHGDLLNKVAQLEALREKPGGYASIWMKDREYFVSWQQSPWFAWKTVRLLPMAQAVEAQRTANIITLLVALAGVGLSFLVLTFSSRQLTRPVRQLQAGMRQVEDGDLTVRLAVESQDELHSLFVSFNTMAERLERLVDEVYVKEIQKKEAQLLALQQQINPHFLYNTLDSIQMVALMNKDFEVSRMTTMLAQMFRYTISSHYEEVSLREELEYVSNYIVLQQVRFDNAFAFEVEVPEELELMPVPKLSIQPAVENCLYHGLRRRGRGTVTIAATFVEGGYQIKVADDGDGMDPARLQRLRAALLADEQEKKGRIGLKNVDMRLKAAFGEGSGVLVESEEGAGTTVILRIQKEE